MYRLAGLDPSQFDHYRGKSAAELAALHAQRVIADEPDSYPCRVSLRDVDPGDALLLVNFEHLPVDSPYRSRHAIFVSEARAEPAVYVDAVPGQLQRRLLSVRAFDAEGMMIAAEVGQGTALAELIATFFADERVRYLHVHFAKRGCFAARVDRSD